MTEKFDGAKVKKVRFHEVGILCRFFDENGVGYTKHSETECYDDYSFRKIQCNGETHVWVKE